MDGDIKAYLSRWQAVATIERQEQLASSLELRWEQLNAVYGLAIELGFDNSRKEETEVIAKWLKLNEAATCQNPGA